MQSCDVLIIGAGPAGTSCAWKLRSAGLDVLILDRQRFPRDKVCGGWVTPAVFEELRVDPGSYAAGRVLQPITGFRTGGMGGHAVETIYHKTVSYGVRRFELDHFLLRRSSARALEGTTVAELRRNGGGWIVNDAIRTPLVVGAGGHFCPVARFLGARLGAEAVVAAQEIEFPLDARQQAQCRIVAEIPELYFCQDMKGYGWAFRKGNFLNLGLGRMGNRNLARHAEAFLEFLKGRGRIPRDAPSILHGHAYLLYGGTPRNLLADGVLLVGDAAGLAYAQSGEGIRPAVESGLLAAQAILAAQGKYGRENLEGYRALLRARFGNAEKDWTFHVTRCLPQRLTAAVAARLLAMRWFSRHVLLDRWFLHVHQPALDAG